MWKSIQKLAEQLFSEEESSETGTEDYFISLMSVASDDAAIRSQILTILRQNAKKRKTDLEAWISELQAKHAPQQIVEALKYLLDDDTANRAIQLLSTIEK